MEEKCKALNALEMKGLLQMLPTPIYWLDRTSKLVGCNPSFAEIAGFSSPQELIGKTACDLPWREFAPQMIAANDQVIAEEKPALLEEEFSLPNGERVVYLTHKIPRYNAKGEVIGLVCFATDITAQKKLEAANAGNHVKTEFIANMCHDIRNPLSGIVQMSSALKEKLKMGNDGKQESVYLEASGTELLHLFSDILDIVNAGNYSEETLDLESFDLSQLMGSIIKLQMPMIQSKGLLLKRHIDKKIPNCLLSDRTKLHRILLNLVGNAIKFTHEGQITLVADLLETKSNKLTIKFSVVDTGVGIAADAREKVFDRFYQVNTSHKALGHGLGLSIVYKYVQLLGGQLTVESQEGRGSSFSFTLSCELGDEQSLSSYPEEEFVDYASINPEETSHAKAELPSDAPSLLLIEDNFIGLHALEALVTQLGCRFQSAYSAEQGLELWSTHSFDLIITDIGLSGLSGIELTKHIRALEKNHQKPETPIMGLTGHPFQDIEQECLQAGMNKVLVKPATQETLKAVMQHFLTKSEDAISASLQIPRAMTNEQSSPLGVDLPNTEEELFLLQHHALFDETAAKELLGACYEKMINELLTSMIKQIDEDEVEMAQAFTDSNWQLLQELAHRAKGGAAACGVARLRYACQYLERYHKAGHTKLIEQLYHQLTGVMDETKSYLCDWLANGGKATVHKKAS